MKCPGCGAEIKNGFLYCEVCGEEINIVPDFEPELENSMNEILTNVADDMAEDLADERYDGKVGAWSKEHVNRKSDRKKLIGVGITGGFVIVLLIAGILFYRHNSFEHQMQTAERLVEAGQHENAINYYQRALEIDKKSSLAKYRMAQAVLELGDAERALRLFKEVVAADGDDMDVRRSACGVVIDIYSQTGDYKAISDFLLDMGDNDITNSFQKYKAKAPEFSYVEGFYEEVIPLKLTASTSGTIFYTTDGSEPDTNSEMYTSPIFLESGDYIISAFFINDFGVQSEVVKKAYHVEVPAPFAPEVSAYSGDYDSPTLIHVEIPDECRVYYTSNGTEPTSDSSEYVAPIHMPVGKSTFKFVAYNDAGIAGEITTRNYNLTLRTDIRIADAEAIITQGMYEYGKIYDLSGLSYDTYGRYYYKYQYATNIENVGDFYIVAEIHEDTQGIQSRTGALFAVGLYDGKRYRLSLDEANQYVFNEF